MNILTLIALPLFHIAVYNSFCTITQTYDVDEVGITTDVHLILIKDGKETEIDVGNEKGVEVTVEKLKWVYEVQETRGEKTLTEVESLGCEKIYKEIK